MPNGSLLSALCHDGSPYQPKRRQYGIRKSLNGIIISQNVKNIGIYKNFPKIKEIIGGQQKYSNYRKYRRSGHSVYIFMCML